MYNQRRGIKTIALEIKDNTKNGVPYSLTFAPTATLTQQQVKILEDYLKYNFNLWAKTWIDSLADEIIEKFGKIK